MSNTELSLLLTTALGAFLSLAFSYIPALSKWFYGINEDYRGLVMLGLNLAVAVALFGATCTGFYTTVTCDGEGAKQLLWAFLLALGANQVTYMVTPKSPVKKEMEEAEA